MEQNEIRTVAQQIITKIELLSRSSKAEESKLKDEWRIVKQKCSHPNTPKISNDLQYQYTHLGFGFSLMCPDCGCDCGPNDDGSSETDEYYSLVKMPQELVLQLARDVRNKQRLAQEEYYAEVSILRKRLIDIQQKCLHVNLSSSNLCLDCGLFVGEILF